MEFMAVLLFMICLLCGVIFISLSTGRTRWAGFSGLSITPVTHTSGLSETHTYRDNTFGYLLLWLFHATFLSTTACRRSKFNFSAIEWVRVCVWLAPKIIKSVLRCFMLLRAPSGGRAQNVLRIHTVPAGHVTRWIPPHGITSPPAFPLYPTKSSRWLCYVFL